VTQLSRAAAIVGVHEHPTRHAPDKSEWQLLAEASIGALHDAGLGPTDIDAFFTSATAPEGGQLGSSAAVMMSDYLNVHPKFIDETDVGGASYGYYLNRAVLGIQAGLFNTALIAYGATTRSQRVNVGTLGFNALTGKSSMAPTPDAFEEPYGLTVVGLVGTIAQRYMHTYGLTSEQLARVAVTMRRHAGLNPDAMFRNPITVEDVLNSPIIATPLHKLDCCVISDGAAAVIVTSADRARNTRKKPVWVLGFGESHMHHEAGYGDWAEESRNMVTRAAEQAYGMAGVGPQDLNAAMVYDPFTINVIMDLEGMGVCGIGEGGAFVEEGRIDLGGQLPVNPDGGGLSSNHPGRRGIFLFVEATRQLRGEGGQRQVPNADVVACTATGAAFLARRGSTVHILGRD
jgi:acetyl-CoA C-acetyltransferase